MVLKFGFRRIMRRSPLGVDVSDVPEGNKEKDSLATQIVRGLDGNIVMALDDGAPSFPRDGCRS